MMYNKLFRFVKVPTQQNFICRIFLKDQNMLQERPFAIFVGNKTSELQRQKIYKGNPNSGPSMYWIVLNPPRLLQYVRIEQNTGTTMKVCEVLVYDAGRFDNKILPPNSNFP